MNNEPKINRIKVLLNKLDEEYQKLDHYHRARLAIEQISNWRQKFEEAKSFL